MKTATVVPLQERLTGNLQVTLWVLMGAVIVVLLIGVRQHLEPPARARHGQDARDRAPRRARRRPGPCGASTVDRKLCARRGGRAGRAPARVTLVEALVALSPAAVPRLDELRIDRPSSSSRSGFRWCRRCSSESCRPCMASRLDVSGALKQGDSKATGTRVSARLRSALVVAEVALSVILLVAAGLLLRSFQTLQHVDLGFTKERVLVAETVYAVRDGVTEDSRNRSRFYADVLDRLRAVPGVRAASGVAYLADGARAPSRLATISSKANRRANRVSGHKPSTTRSRADYFKTLEIPVRAGRDFDQTDTPERPQVAIINEAMARIAFPGESPLGQQFDVNSRPPWMEIVGLSPTPGGRIRVARRRWWSSPHRRRAGASRWPFWLGPRWTRQSLAGTLRTLLHDANPTVPISSRPWTNCSWTLAYPRFRTQIIGLFAAVAALLAAVGIFSVLAYLVGQRTREIASDVPLAPGSPMSSASSSAKGSDWWRSASCGTCRCARRGAVAQGASL